MTENHSAEFANLESRLRTDLPLLADALDEPGVSEDHRRGWIVPALLGVAMFAAVIVGYRSLGERDSSTVVTDETPVVDSATPSTPRLELDPELRDPVSEEDWPTLEASACPIDPGDGIASSGRLVRVAYPASAAVARRLQMGLEDLTFDDFLTDPIDASFGFACWRVDGVVATGDGDRSVIGDSFQFSRPEFNEEPGFGLVLLPIDEDHSLSIRTVDVPISPDSVPVALPALNGEFCTSVAGGTMRVSGGRLAFEAYPSLEILARYYAQDPELSLSDFATDPADRDGITACWYLDATFSGRPGSEPEPPGQYLVVIREGGGASIRLADDHPLSVSDLELWIQNPAVQPEESVDPPLPLPGLDPEEIITMQAINGERRELSRAEFDVEMERAQLANQPLEGQSFGFGLLPDRTIGVTSICVEVVLTETEKEAWREARPEFLAVEVPNSCRTVFQIEIVGVGLATRDVSAGSEDAIGRFEIRYDSARLCFYGLNPDDPAEKRTAIVWPEGSVGWPDPARVVDSDGVVIAADGDTLEAAGGLHSADDFDQWGLPTERCGALGPDSVFVM